MGLNKVTQLASITEWGFEPGASQILVGHFNHYTILALPSKSPKPNTAPAPLLSPTQLHTCSSLSGEKIFCCSWQHCQREGQTCPLSPSGGPSLGLISWEGCNVCLGAEHRDTHSCALSFPLPPGNIQGFLLPSLITTSIELETLCSGNGTKPTSTA